MTTICTSKRRQFRTVTASQRCPICHRPDWCGVSTDGDIALCRRVNDGTAKVRQYKDGGEYYCYRLHGAATPGPFPEATIVPEAEAQRADPETLDRVYSALLDKLPLQQHHVYDLQQRGLDDNLLDGGYRSWPLEGRAQLVRQLIDLGLEQHFPFVPGFRLREGTNGHTYWTLFGSPGLVIPVRDAAGRIRALLIRPNKQVPGKKYVYLSSKRADYNGPGPGSPIHVPPFDGDKTTIRVTEGALKANVATALSDTLTIGLPGVGAIRRAVKGVRYLGATTVRLAFDANAPHKPNVASARRRLAEELRDDGFLVELEVWDLAGGKGIDDLLHHDQTPQVLTGADVFSTIENIVAVAGIVPAPASNPSNQPQPPQADRPCPPTILIGVDEERVNNEAVTSSKAEQRLFQRCNALAHVLRDHAEAEHILRPAGTPRIVAVPRVVLREMMASNIQWHQLKTNRKGDVEWLPAHPPGWSVANIAERGCWSGIRPLEAVVEAPTLRPNGTVLDVPGRDAATGLLYEPRIHFPAVPTNPSWEEARVAADTLTDMVAEFPFAGSPSAQMAAWLTALLTPLARFAFAGPAPLFLFDANAPGSGKTLLASLISEITEGRELSRTPFPADNAEIKKTITAIALNGDKLILLDNIDPAVAFGCASLDAALTGTTWEDRILGSSEMIRLPLFTVWYASGNNVALRGDANRRILPIKLETLEEKPEGRSDFKYPDLVSHVRGHRASLVVASLTILRGYVAAGRPSAHLPPLGSYEGWSGLVRGAVHWATGCDPAATRQALPADESRSSLGAILEGWAELPQGTAGETVAEALRLVRDQPEKYRTLYDAFMSWARDHKLLGPRVVGNRLRTFKNRVLNGKALVAGMRIAAGISVGRLLQCRNRRLRSLRGLRSLESSFAREWDRGNVLLFSRAKIDSADSADSARNGCQERLVPKAGCPATRPPWPCAPCRLPAAAGVDLTASGRLPGVGGRRALDQLVLVP